MGKPVVYTVGHSNHSMDVFIQMLTNNRINFLCDVRSKPYSQYNPHFSQQNLRSVLNSYGIKYKWAGKQLGGRSAISVGDPEFVEKIEKLEVLAEDYKVAIMCSEKDPGQCHRAGKLGLCMVKRDMVDVRHILPDDVIEFEKARLTPGIIWHEYGGDYNPGIK